MARGDLACPVCGSLLGLPGVTVKGGTDVTRDGLIGGHVHLTVTGTWTCANGHSWNAKGDLLLERVS